MNLFRLLLFLLDVEVVTLLNLQTVRLEVVLHAWVCLYNVSSLTTHLKKIITISQMMAVLLKSSPWIPRLAYIMILGTIGYPNAWVRRIRDKLYIMSTYVEVVNLVTVFKIIRPSSDLKRMCSGESTLENLMYIICD